MYLVILQQVAVVLLTQADIMVSAVLVVAVTLELMEFLETELTQLLIRVQAVVVEPATTQELLAVTAAQVLSLLGMRTREK